MKEDSELAFNNCSEEGCQFRQTGECLNGIDLTNDICTHAFIDPTLSIALEESMQEGNDLLEDALQKNVIGFFTGEELEENEIKEVTFQDYCKLVLLMGEPNSGKTTLLAALFDEFQHGPIGKYYFAGSKTQLGLEKRCFLARGESRRLTPDTERTLSNDFKYLHLDVKLMDNDSRKLTPIHHLIFTDVSGERFKLVRDDEMEATGLQVLNYADSVIYVINGDSLSDNKFKFSAKNSLFKLIKRLNQAFQSKKEIKIVVLINKWDIVISRNAEEEVETFFCNSLIETFPINIVSIHKVAARCNPAFTASRNIGLEEFIEVITKSNVSLNFRLPYPPLAQQLREFMRNNLNSY